MHTHTHTGRNTQIFIHFGTQRNELTYSRPSRFLINWNIELRTFDSESNVLPTASSGFKLKKFVKKLV